MTKTKKTVEIVRPEGLADHVDLHFVRCGHCGHEGEPSADRGALVIERDTHGLGRCCKPTRKEQHLGKRAPKGIRNPAKPRGRR